MKDTETNKTDQTIETSRKKAGKSKGRALKFLTWALYFALVVDLENIVIAIFDRQAALWMLPVSVVLTVAAALLYWYQRARLRTDILNMAEDNAQIQHRILTDFPMPYGMMDEEGHVLWGNALFFRILRPDRSGNSTLWDLIPEVKAKEFPLKDRTYMRHVQLDDAYYKLEIDNIPVPDEMIAVDQLGMRNSCGGLYTVYLFDETEEVRYRQDIENEKMVVGLIYLDNYDEVLGSLEEVRRSLLVALLDRRITRYVTRTEGLIKKMETDKYLVLWKMKNLVALKEDKFALLDDVKTVNIGNDMAVTLSIGIGVGGDSYQKNYDYARTAIDMALGRGGDQAVVKNRDSISYYGGRTQQMEKNTRVKARVKAHALRELMESCETVLVMGHSIGDWDAFGAAVGIHRIAATLGKRAYIVADDVSSAIRPMLDRVQALDENRAQLVISGERAREMVEPRTLIVVVDVNRPSHTECPAILNGTCDVVVLDHHRETEEQIQNAVLSYVESYASSTCELVAEILQYVDDDIRLSSVEAEIMYAGIVLDTNNFLSKTGVRTFEAAAYLRRCGADVVRVRKLLRDNMDDYKARARAVSQAEIFAQSFAISTCQSEGLDSPTVVGAQAANELLNIVGVKASFVLTPYNGVVYISARSIDEVNVQVIMERFGGGGHMTVAGAQLRNCSVDDAKELVKETVIKMAEEGDI